MIGKLHEQSREPCILPLQLDKIKFTKHHQVFYIQYFTNTPTFGLVISFSPLFFPDVCQHPGHIRLLGASRSKPTQASNRSI